MARNSKDGKTSDVTKKLLKEEAETVKRDAERHAENIKVGEASMAKNIENGNTDKGVVAPKVNEKERKARWDALLKSYEERNPVKFAAKKAAGEFDEMPASF